MINKEAILRVAGPLIPGVLIGLSVCILIGISKIFGQITMLLAELIFAAYLLLSGWVSGALSSAYVRVVSRNNKPLAVQLQSAKVKAFIGFLSIDFVKHLSSVPDCESIDECRARRRALLALGIFVGCTAGVVVLLIWAAVQTTGS